MVRLNLFDKTEEMQIACKIIELRDAFAPHLKILQSNYDAISKLDVKNCREIIIELSDANEGFREFLEKEMGLNLETFEKEDLDCLRSLTNFFYVFSVTEKLKLTTITCMEAMDLNEEKIFLGQACLRSSMFQPFLEKYTPFREGKPIKELSKQDIATLYYEINSSFTSSGPWSL